MKPSINEAELVREIYFKTTRSSGKGGQHVNKVATRAEAYLDIPGSACFDPGEKELLLEKLTGRINRDGVLQVSSEAGRSQFLNKEDAVEKMLRMIRAALTPVKPRKATKPSRASKEKRLRDKSAQSRKKALRRTAPLNAETGD
ncbi:MAG: alternative ribosome rescue aminoacyl-tRNA hydrolase ArfB [Solitalea sp.]